jgi:ankyrin repeat protein
MRRAEVPLINLLCDSGAETDGALQAAAAHGEFEAARALIALGARVTLPIAAALGKLDDAVRLLPRADERDRHLALALAAQFGHVEIVRLLLDAGEDPDRYNAPGGHSHSTPLHQAAFAGHEAVVRLLVERGARLDLKDVLWHGTPAGWARYAGRTQLAEYLERQYESRQHSGSKPK